MVAVLSHHVLGWFVTQHKLTDTPPQEEVFEKQASKHNANDRGAERRISDWLVRVKDWLLRLEQGVSEDGVSNAKAWHHFMSLRIAFHLRTWSSLEGARFYNFPKGLPYATAVFLLRGKVQNL